MGVVEGIGGGGALGGGDVVGGIGRRVVSFSAFERGSWGESVGIGDRYTR